MNLFCFSFCAWQILLECETELLSVTVADKYDGDMKIHFTEPSMHVHDLETKGLSDQGQSDSDWEVL